MIFAFCVDFSNSAFTNDLLFSL